MRANRIRSALGLLAAAIALLAIAWLVRSTKPAAPAQVAGPLAQGATGAEETGAAPTAPAAPAESASSARAEAAAVAGEASSAPPERSVVLRVVDAPHGNGIAGAHVRFADDPELYGELSDFWESERSDFDGFERIIARRSREVVADGAGEVRVETRRQHAFAIASSPDLWGWATIDPHVETPQEIVLLPDAELSVKVVDPAGAPVAGVTVYADNGADDFDSAREHTMRAVTAADGTVRMSHLRWWMENEPGRAVVLSVEALLAAPVRIPLERARFPREPVVIALPFTGSVEVVQKDERDEERVLAYTIELVDVPDDAATEFDIGRRSQLQGLFESSNDPRVRFPFVETGLTVQASGRIYGAAQGVLSGRSAGPRAAGDHVEIVLGGAALLPVLVGRALDTEGEPLRSANVRTAFLVLRDSSQSSSSRMMPTDAEGRFRIVLDPAELRATSRKLSLSCWPAGAASAIDVELELEAEYAPGVHDLGDVRLETPPLAAAGVVVDETGRPVPGAAVSLVEIRAPGAPHLFEWRPREPTRTDAGGAFALRDRGDAREIGLQASAVGLVSPPLVRVARGSQSVRIVMTRAATVSGELVFDERVQAADLNVAWFPSAEVAASFEAPAGLTRSTGVQHDGKFELTYLEPGVGRVEVSLIGQPPLRTLAGVVARAGETTRLEPIDLRSEKFFTLELRTPDGALPDVESGAVFARRSGGASGWSQTTRAGGRVVLSAREGPLDVIAAFEGWRLGQLEGIAHDTRLVLRPGIPVSLTVALAGIAPEPPVRLGVTLVPPSEGGPEALGRFAVPVSTTLDPRGAGRALLGLPGRWRVDWYLERSSADSRTREGIAVQAPRWLEVADSDAGTSVALEVPGEVAARLATLRDH